MNHGIFHEIGLSAIRPAGWLRRYLEKQRDGFTGHLEIAGPSFDTKWWGSDEGFRTPGPFAQPWEPFEHSGYWIDGMIRCGHLLQDDWLIDKAGRVIEYVITHPDPDGYLGPRYLKPDGRWYRWPHAVFFRALMAHHSATQDTRIVEALRRHYLAGTNSHAVERHVVNVEAILWTYEHSGDERLLQHALAAYQEYNRLYADAGPACLDTAHTGSDTTVKGMLADRPGTEHGVTYNEIGKLGAIVYQHTGQREYLDATIHAYRKLDQYHMLIDGIPSSAEHLRGKDPLEVHENCVISDYTWGVGYLLLATGRAEYADKIERACFNAAPGAVTSDLRALQYFSSPNQVIADTTSNHNHLFRGNRRMSYRLDIGCPCCAGNIHRVMPNFAARMWLRDNENGLVAALYGPSAITARVGKQAQEVTVTEQTDYPFSDVVEFTLSTPVPVAFAFTFRIPGWCQHAQAFVNGSPVDQQLVPGTFVTLRRLYLDGDRVTIRLPMTLSLSQWPQGGIGLERGPLVYALRIEEDWQVDETDTHATPDFPAWNLYAASPWNYALALNSDTVVRDVQVLHKPMSTEPWSLRTAPIELRVPARRVNGWELERTDTVISTFDENSDWVTRTVHGQFVLTPQLPNPVTLPARLAPHVETVTLVPYGCAHLRISVFPKAQV